DIKAASLRTLTSIVHLERTPKLSSIIDCTGTASYHGFLPVLVRNCIQAMIDPSMEPYPHQFATALFSFLYHLASYDAGGEALVSCGMMEALLKVSSPRLRAALGCLRDRLTCRLPPGQVIKFLGDEQDQITFVTRAVRVVDLITNLDMAAFQSHSGLSIFIYRLEVLPLRRGAPGAALGAPRCSGVPPGLLWVPPGVLGCPRGCSGCPQVFWGAPGAALGAPRCSGVPPGLLWVPPGVLGCPRGCSGCPQVFWGAPGAALGAPRCSGVPPGLLWVPPGVQCIPQRAALLKSMLNFLKKAIQDPAFSDGIRHVMDGSLPTSLKHIISNAEYYGPSLFLL
ncbi:HUWE1 ligase, partial [Tichodroma muraria]|nr:HUWE1 ligase [Tichodroma muraria]